jgi:dTDP-4-amino-4,6-dideoxygalactose transaminase
MDEMSAILGRASLGLLDRAVARRNEVASLYRRRLGRLQGVSFQEVDPRDRSSYKDFTIAVDADGAGISRGTLARALGDENVDTRAYYDPPCHLTTAFRRFAPGDGGNGGRALERTERLSARCLSLPIWSGMDEATAAGVCEAVERILARAPEVAAAVEVRPRAGEPAPAGGGTDTRDG